MLLLIIVEKRLFRRVCLEASPRLQFLLKIAILADLLGSQSKTTVLIQTNNFLASFLGNLQSDCSVEQIWSTKMILSRIW